MDEFEDIRPYRDDEVRPVVDRLLQDKALSSALAKFRQPLLYTFFPGWVTKKTHASLSEEIAHVQTIHDVQKIIEQAHLIFFSKDKT